MSNSCANCASVAPSSLSALFWVQTSFQQRQHQEHTSFATATTEDPYEFENDEDLDVDGNYYGDHEDDFDDERIAIEPHRPLAFLRTRPFPGLNLSIDGSPIAIVDTGRSVFDEETIKTNLTGARAIATILWNWHPNALRAFLDCEKWPDFEFSICDEYPESETSTTYLILRMGREVHFGQQNEDMDWRHLCIYEIPETGRWVPKYGSDGFSSSHATSWVHSMSSMWAMDQMYHTRWESQENRVIELRMFTLKADPAKLY
ncbi:hypothetical protein KCU65_g5788, partial [Aureobasidium melanogenum]